MNIVRQPPASPIVGRLPGVVLFVLVAGFAAAGLAAADVLPVWALVLILLVAVCPVLAVWLFAWSARPLPVPVGPPPATRANTLNWLAPWYDAVCARLGLGGAFVSRVAATAQVRPGERILDLGCATGALASRAAHATGPTGKVCGVDPAPDMVRMALQCAGRTPCHPSFQLAAPERLPFGDASFDAVIASLVLCRLPADAKAAALAEAGRVLTPGGRLVVADFDRPRGGLWRLIAGPLQLDRSLGPHLSGRTPDMLRAAGFAAVRRAAWGPLLSVWEARPTPALTVQKGAAR